MRTILVMLLAGAGLMFATRASAHHAFAAEFDSTKPIKLRGTVVKMEWINPHTWIHLDVKTPKGTVERWMIEGGPAKCPLPEGIHAEVSAEGRRDFGRGIPREGRVAQGQWARSDLRGWTPAVRRFLWHRCPARWQGRNREVMGISARKRHPPSGSSRSAPSRRCSRRTRIPGGASLPAASIWF